jgi:hypothetical protein
MALMSLFRKTGDIKATPAEETIQDLETPCRKIL